MKAAAGALALGFCAMQPSHADVPADRLATLARGVNIITVFSNTPLSQILGDLHEVRAAGLRHIRIFVDPYWVLQFREGVKTRLDQVVSAAVDDRLGVILCMNSPQHKLDDKADAPIVAQWGQAWEQLADKYAALPPDRIFFELTNEPTMAAPRWGGVQAELLQRARRVAPRNTILLTPSPTSMAGALVTLPPYHDDDVAYAIHLYQPVEFTYQGGEWDTRFVHIHGLEYPPDPANIASVKQHAPRQDLGGLDNYLHNGATAMRQEVDAADQWARAHGAHVVVTEFGAYRDAPPRSRAVWFAETIADMQRAEFGWTVWEYDGGFGIKPNLIACTAITHMLQLRSPACATRRHG